MLHRFQIAHFKSFGEEQTVTLAEPGDGRYGLTVLVGPNNAGKSTVLAAIRRLFEQVDTFKVTREDKRADGVPSLIATFTGTTDARGRGKPLVASLSGENTLYFGKKITTTDPDANFRTQLERSNIPGQFIRIKPIGSRRPWSDDFNARNNPGAAYA